MVVRASPDIRVYYTEKRKTCRQASTVHHTGKGYKLSGRADSHARAAQGAKAQGDKVHKAGQQERARGRAGDEGAERLAPQGDHGLPQQQGREGERGDMMGGRTGGAYPAVDGAVVRALAARVEEHVLVDLVAAAVAVVEVESWWGLG